MKIIISMSVKLNHNVAQERLKEYIESAITAWQGSLQPPGYGPGGEDPNEAGDPMFGNVRHVEVIRIETLGFPPSY